MSMYASGGTDNSSVNYIENSNFFIKNDDSLNKNDSLVASKKPSRCSAFEQLNNKSNSVFKNVEHESKESLSENRTLRPAPKSPFKSNKIERMFQKAMKPKESQLETIPDDAPINIDLSLKFANEPLNSVSPSLNYSSVDENTARSTFAPISFSSIVARSTTSSPLSFRDSRSTSESQSRPIQSSPSPFSPTLTPLFSPTSSSPFGGRSRSENSVVSRRSISSNTSFSYTAIKELSGKQVSKIRYSQDSCGATTRSGHTIEKLALSMMTKGFERKSAIHIVLMPDGIYTSIDNRRLVASKSVNEVYNVSLPIFVKIHQYDEIADEDRYEKINRQFEELMKNESEKSKSYWKKSPKEISDNTWGKMVILRMKSCASPVYDVNGSEKFGYSKIIVR